MDETGICVVTHPITEAAEPAISGLLELVSAAAGSNTALITANLPSTSQIRDKYEYTEISSSGVGNTVLLDALRFLLNQIRMCNEIRKRDEEVILFFGATAYFLPILFSRLLGKRVVLEPRGNVPKSLYRIWRERMPNLLAYLLTRPLWLLERGGYITAHAIMVLSPAMTEDLGLERYREGKLHEHGARSVDLDRFRLSTPYGDRGNRLGYLGRLDGEKGVDRLLEVVKSLPEEIPFVFVGDGEMRPLIEEELDDRIRDGTVEIVGWVDHDEVPVYLNSIKMLVMTSRTEGVPTTALEAMACGTPVCATPVGGVPDVVIDGETGLLLESESEQEMAERISSLLADEERLREMSRSSQKFVVENYSFEAVVERYEQLLEDVY